MIRIRDEQPGSYFRKLRKQFFGLKYLKFGMGIRIQDPGWKKNRIRDGKNSDPGSRIRNTATVLPNKHVKTVFVMLRSRWRAARLA
jgi:hypothetical protein